MNRQPTPALRQGSVITLVLGLALSMMLGAPLARAQDAGEAPSQALSNAEFRWGLNPESAGLKTFSGHNFLAAGDVSASLTDAGQALKEGQWERAKGDVRIEKAPGTLATWQDATPSGSGSSGLEMVFSRGTGEVDPANEAARISWAGTASVVYYSGQSFFTISDPVLTIEKNSAQVTATLNGFESAQGAATWNKLPEKKNVVLASIPREKIALESKGFSVSPDYRGVRYPASDQVDNEYFGSFPKPFVDYVSQVGIGPYWYSTGGSADSRKLPLPITVSWDAADRAPVSGGGSQGVLGQVIDDTVEDIVRAAGTDVSDTAAAWMDEAWKPLQPDAVKAAQQDGAIEGPSDEVAPAEGRADGVFEEHYEEYYTSTTPMTAGTVAGTVASIAASSSGGSGSRALESSPASAQVATPVAADLPLTDVVYAHTSASSEAGNPTHQWQWWVGSALLALAAVLFYQTVRRRDFT